MNVGPGSPNRRGGTRDFRFVPVSPRDRDWGLYVIGAGCGSIPPHSSYPLPHDSAVDWVWQRGRVLQDYAVVYIVRGEGEFESEPTGHQRVQAGDAFLLFPGIRHRYRPAKETGWEECWAIFQGEYADCLRERGFLAPEDAVLRIGHEDGVPRAFTTLLDRIRGDTCSSQQLLAASVMEIVAGLLSAAQRHQLSDHLQKVVGQIKVAMDTALADRATIGEIAQAMQLSPSYLYQAFKRLTGISPYQYRLQTQISRAKELLHNSSLSIKQIALAVRFNSVYQFSKTFKKKTGMTPGEYRHGGPAPRPRGRPVGCHKSFRKSRP